MFEMVDMVKDGPKQTRWDRTGQTYLSAAKTAENEQYVNESGFWVWVWVWDWFWDRDWDWDCFRANRLERGEPMGGKPRMANERLRTRTRSLGLCSGIDIVSYRNGLGFSRRLIASKKDMRICAYPVQTECQPRFLQFSSFFCRLPGPRSHSRVFVLWVYNLSLIEAGKFA